MVDPRTPRTQDSRLLDLVRLLTEEEDALVDHLAHDETEDLAEVQASNHLLERLLARLVGGLVDVNIVRGARQVLVSGRVERAPFAVDCHLWIDHGSRLSSLFARRSSYEKFSPLRPREGSSA